MKVRRLYDVDRASMAQIINMHGRRGQVPLGAVYVGRAMRWVGLRRSKWANPFKIGRDGTRDEVIARYRDWLLQQPEAGGDPIARVFAVRGGVGGLEPSPRLGSAMPGCD